MMSYPYVAESAGLILLIGPEEYAALELPRGQGDSGQKLVNVVDAVINFLKRRGIERRVPAAVVVTKLDEFRSQIYRGSPIHDESRHKDGLDAASVRLISDEVASYLAAWGGGDLVHKVAENFPEHSFFALSALGQRPDPQTRRVTCIRPHRVADPLLWLFWKLGYIPDCQGNWHDQKGTHPR